MPTVWRSSPRTVHSAALAVAGWFPSHSRTGLGTCRDERDRRIVCLMADRAADRVTVPDVVGLPFHIGRDVAAEAGVALANPDPDGPPIAALTWPGLFYITAQSPAAGATLYRWDSVAVETSPYREGGSDAISTAPEPPTPDNAHARPDRVFFTDLIEDNEPNA